MPSRAYRFSATRATESEPGVSAITGRGLLPVGYIRKGLCDSSSSSRKLTSGPDQPPAAAFEHPERIAAKHREHPWPPQSLPTKEDTPHERPNKTPESA